MNIMNLIYTSRQNFVARMIYATMLILTVAILGSSCSTCKNIDRAERKVAKIVECHPQLALKDTVEFEVIVSEKVLVHDTTFVTKPVDTIEFENEVVKFQFIRKFDTLYVDNIISKTDTIIRYVEVPVEIKVEPKPNFFQRFFLKSRIIMIGLGLLVLVVIAVIFPVIRKLIFK